MNVISGVVREDFPASKVRNHFYHAYSGEASEVPLFSSVPSREKALDFLTSATNIFGYEAYPEKKQFNPDEWQNLNSFPATSHFAKMLSFQTFGEALHHVEDMSSIAHVHDDAHLVTEESERDDYEGHYLPEIIFRLHGGQGRNWFTETRGQTPVAISSIGDIWPEPAGEMQWQTRSLARRVFNASVFGARLSTPGRNRTTFGDSIREGELFDMFGNRLKYVRRNFRTHPLLYFRLFHRAFPGLFCGVSDLIYQIIRSGDCFRDGERRRVSRLSVAACKMPCRAPAM